MGSFYIGYMITHIPGGVLASRYGGKYVLMASLGSSAVLTLITPICVMAGGSTAFIILRVLIGLAEGPVFPTCNALLAAWVPLKERSQIATAMFSGSQVTRSFYLLFTLFYKKIFPYIIK